MSDFRWCPSAYVRRHRKKTADVSVETFGRLDGLVSFQRHGHSRRIHLSLGKRDANQFSTSRFELICCCSAGTDAERNPNDDDNTGERLEPEFSLAQRYSGVRRLQKSLGRGQRTDRIRTAFAHGRGDQGPFGHSPRSLRGSGNTAAALLQS